MMSADAGQPAVQKDPFFHAIDRHWREHRPRMVAALEAKGMLDQAIEHAAERTVAAASSLIQQGIPPWQAQERMREEWAFLPSEADVPRLPNGGPAGWLSIGEISSSTSPPRERSVRR